MAKSCAGPERWTVEEYRYYASTGKLHKGNDSCSKYGNKITELDGMKFDSLAEANYYMELKYLKRAGVIKCFCRQPKFILEKAFAKNGKRFCAITYTADFMVTHPDNRVDVIDVKGVLTKEFRIKWKLFEKRYPEYSLQLVRVEN